MHLIDYHIHTKYSHDSREELDAICERAIRMGLDEIAFTDHVEIVENDEFDRRINLGERTAEIGRVKKKYSGKLVVRNGIELGQPQRNALEADRFYKTARFDFIIGSIHSLNRNIQIGTFRYTGDNCYRFYTGYMDALTELLSGYDFDVLGHVTLPLREMPVELTGTFDIALFEEKYRRLFLALIEKGKGIELNTYTFGKANRETPFLEAILRWYRECGGEVVTIGSDAHSEREVASGIRAGYDMLEHLNFKYIATFENRNIVYKALK